MCAHQENNFLHYDSTVAFEKSVWSSGISPEHLTHRPICLSDISVCMSHEPPTDNTVQIELRISRSPTPFSNTLYLNDWPHHLPCCSSQETGHLPWFLPLPRQSIEILPARYWNMLLRWNCTSLDFSWDLKSVDTTFFCCCWFFFINFYWGIAVLIVLC